MKVAFLSLQEPPKYANLMVASVHKVMPGIEILQITDMETPEVQGAKAIRAQNEFDSITVFKLNALSKLDGDIIFLDTDVIVQKDLSPVFAFDFDVALTYRTNKIIDGNGADITGMMPYNTGVSFQRNGLFWKACFDLCHDKEPGWYADQLAAAAIARNGQFNILKLHCDNFNYSPHSEDEDLSSRYAVHYKGKIRWMLDKRFGL